MTTDSPTDFLAATKEIAQRANKETSRNFNERKMMAIAPVKTWRIDEDTIIECHRDRIDKAVDRAFEKCFMETSEWPIFLHGHQGRGKTFATRFWAGHVYPKAGCTTLKWYSSVRDLQHDLISDRVAAIRIFRESACVVIDNFGAVSADLNNFIADEMVNLIDKRLTKPLVVISNVGPSEISKTMAAPLASRLLSGTIIEYKGPDRRLMKPHTGEK